MHQSLLAFDNTESCLFIRTALILAALGRHTDCVHILLEKNANPDAADKQGFTALHRAVSCCTSHFSSSVLDSVAHFTCLCCRPCWAARTLFWLCWNTGLLPSAETLGGRRRSTLLHLVVTQSCSTCC